MNDRKKKIRDAMLAGTSLRPESKQSSGGFVVSGGIVVGGNVTLIADSNIHFFADEPLFASKPGMISSDESKKLRALVHELAQIEHKHAQNPVSTAMVWKKLKEKLQVNSYKQIPKERYIEAVETLVSWQSQAFKDRIRSKTSLDGRAKVFRRCHRIAKRYDLYAEMRTLMRTKWKTHTMRGLEDEQLQELLAFMLALEMQYKQEK